MLEANVANAPSTGKSSNSSSSSSAAADFCCWGCSGFAASAAGLSPDCLFVGAAIAPVFSSVISCLLSRIKFRVSLQISMRRGNLCGWLVSCDYWSVCLWFSARLNVEVMLEQKETSSDGSVATRLDNTAPVQYIYVISKISKLV